MLSKSTILSLYFVLAPLVASIFIGSVITENEILFKSFIVNYNLLFGVICVIACTLAIIPPTLLASIWGYFFGWKAILPLFIINFFAILGIYTIACSTRSESILSFVNENRKVKTMLSKVYKSQFEFVFFTKLSPILPFALTNFVFALANIQPKNIVLGGLIGMIPRTILAVWIGLEVNQIRNIVVSSAETAASKIIIFVLILISSVGLFNFFSKKLS
jgi:uncharacterized membrane protein YdjX (TVP38/TMEM64 family)